MHVCLFTYLLFRGQPALGIILDETKVWLPVCFGPLRYSPTLVSLSVQIYKVHTKGFELILTYFVQPPISDAHIPGK